MSRHAPCGATFAAQQRRGRGTIGTGYARGPARMAGMSTYVDIQKFVQQHHGFVPKTSWIAHVKALRGLPTRRAASSRRTVPARKARGHRTGASALRSDLTGELAEAEPDPVSPLVIGERDTRLGVVRHAIDLH